MSNELPKGVSDITPDYDPVSLLRDVVKKIEKGDTRAMHIVLVSKDGVIWRRSCGHAKMEVMWACMTTIFTLMENDD